ncbi:MAG: hypothetical protein J6V68_00140 [Clostridia bacterium]|nr:hypothetical protein [Clostridia bacterium]
MKKIQVCDATIKVAVEEIKKDLSFREKLAISKALEKAGVSVIELPLLSSAKEDAVIYRTIAETMQDTVVCASATLVPQTITSALECLKNAKSKRLQICVPVSTAQMEYIYHLKSAKMLDKLTAVVKDAVASNIEVEIALKDASRAQAGFVVEIAKMAVKEGAKIITLCDDGGVYFPDEFAKLVKEVKENADIKVFVQPSNALQLASATAIEVIKAGADGIKTAIGAKDYLSPDFFADVLRAKGDEMAIETTLDITAIHKTVEEIKGIAKQVVSETNETHYASGVVLTADCELSDVIKEINALGYELSQEDTNKVYQELKRVVEKKGEIGERELEAIIASTAMQVPSTYHLVNYVVNSGNIINATATVTLEKDGEKLCGVSLGDGPIDAAFHAIEQIIGHHYELDDFSVQAVTKGREAVGSAIIRLRVDGQLYSGNGVSTDIVGACIRAYINTLNKIVYEEK